VEVQVCCVLRARTRMHSHTHIYRHSHTLTQDGKSAWHPRMASTCITHTHTHTHLSSCPESST
jgi:hypothetical protein